jgi:two-component system LytT family sensor kinase
MTLKSPYRLPVLLLGYLLLWTSVGAYFGSQFYVMMQGEKNPVPWSRAFTVNLVHYHLWGLVSLIILALLKRYPIEPARWWRALALHLPASLLLTVLELTAAELILGKLGIGSSQNLGYRLRLNFKLNFHGAYPTYWAVLAVASVRDYYLKYRARELQSSQLEAQLSAAQLQALKMQLHPHFLFNTLNGIAALMHQDVEAADRMLARLSELLRIALDSAEQQEVALRQEMDFLDRYLEIQKMRFRDRLTVKLELDPETLDAMVPNLILQPLVENAIRHGIEPRSAPGEVVIRASRAGDRLELQVSDDGPGMPANGAGQGVGLANTRARLQQLYGAAHQLTFSNGPAGGLVIVLSLPFRLRGAEKS